MIVTPGELVMPQAYQDMGNPNVKIAVFGNDGDIGIRFFVDAQFREAKSQALGYQCYEDVEMIEFYIDRYTKSARMVTDADKRKYHELYERFQRGLGTKGVLIDKWEMITPAERSMITAAGFITVEQLAECSDSRLETMPPNSHALRAKAKQEVNARSGKIDTEKYGDVILALQRQVAEMQAKEAAREAQESEVGSDEPEAPVVRRKRGPNKKKLILEENSNGTESK